MYHRRAIRWYKRKMLATLMFISGLLLGYAVGKAKPQSTSNH